jgi:hypothetical protein
MEIKSASVPKISSGFNFHDRSMITTSGKNVYGMLGGKAFDRGSPTPSEYESDHRQARHKGDRVRARPPIAPSFFLDSSRIAEGRSRTRYARSFSLVEKRVTAEQICLLISLHQETQHPAAVAGSLNSLSTPLGVGE